MASREHGSQEAASPASAFLPLSRKRAGSIVSVTSQVDKETLSQALDQIHTSASRSEALTTFNEFAAPPSASGSNEGKSIAGDIQGGISGLYSRLRASVGPAKEGILQGSVEGADDAVSTRSSRTAGSVPLSASKITFKSTRATSPAGSAHSSKLEAAPLPSSGGSIASTAAREAVKEALLTRSSSQQTTATATTSSGKPNTNAPRQVIGGLSHPSTSVASPAVAEVNISATRGHGAQSKNDVGSGENKSVPATIKSSATAEKKSSGAVEQLRATDDKMSRSKSRPSIPYGRQGSATRLENDNVNRLSFRSESVFSDNRKSESSSDLKIASPTHLPASPSTPTFRADIDRSHLGSQTKSTEDSKQGQGSTTESMIDQKFRQGNQSEPSGTSQTSPPDEDAFSAMSTELQSGNISEEEVLNRVGMFPNKPVPASKTEKTGGVSNVLTQIRHRVLSKEYWMKDENAKDCFHCGDAFSTFRRKHHCRTCGQVFDAKCISLVPGSLFGQSGSLRVCKPCEGIVTGKDDSSDYSEEGSVMGASSRSRHGSKGAYDLSPARSFSSLRTAMTDSRDDIPTLVIPAKRRAHNESKRRSTIVEIDAEPKLVRPSSARSLKSMTGFRANASGHKRSHSRSLLQWTLKGGTDERAPFHRSPDESPQLGQRLPAFHSDNVIDPDLAEYMSDESSGDEHFSILEALGDDQVARNGEPEKGSLNGFLASTKKRSRIGDKSVGAMTVNSRDADAMSLSSAKMSNARFPRRRNVSMSSNLHLRPSPRFSHLGGPPTFKSSHLFEVSNSPASTHRASPRGVRMMRSSSMSGPDAPKLDLNSPSIHHVRRLLSQLLRDSNIPHITTWEKALMPILLQATNDVEPDVHNGDDLDIRHYVKLKKILGGRPGDTAYVSGLVFTKKLALKSMPRSIANPRILILTFALEYARREEHFMSLEPVIRQEKEYLQNLVHRIAALNPQLLLCERNVSGLALQYLEEANIATAYNVKPSVLEAVSRCAQTRVITSIDRLAIKPASAGTCASFYLKTYMYNGMKKTYTYLSGCPKQLGCTITLRGADKATLARIKRITEFMIYVVYNLKLETCLMRDEFALMPTYTDVGTILADDDDSRAKAAADADKKPDRLSAAFKTDQRDGVDGDNGRFKAVHATPNTASPPDISKSPSTDDMKLPDDAPMPTFYSEVMERYKDTILSASPSVRFMQPYLLMRAREQERRLVYLRSLRDQADRENADASEDTSPQKFTVITPEMVHEKFPEASKKVQEVLSAIQDAEYDKAVHNYQTRKKQWESYTAGNAKMFDPWLHQNIVVLYSLVCTATSVPCAGPELLALGFYNEHETNQDFEADIALGQYVEDLCLSANSVCVAHSCDQKMLEHHRQYVHGQAQISIKIENYPSKLNGYQDIILMWSVCRICGRETQVMPMSYNTWKYSLGKYLELSFWSYGLRARAGICPHDLHRDHIRFFGYKNLALRVQYDPVTLLEIIVPRTRITWKVVNDLRFKNDVFKKTEERLNRFMNSVKSRITSIKIEGVLPDKAEACREEVERLGQQAKADHTFLVRKLQDKYMGSKYFEIVPLNRAIRALQEKVAEWDRVFADFDSNFFPSDKDIRRLAALQLRKIFLDRDDSVTSFSSTEDRTVGSVVTGETSEKTSPEASQTLIPQTRLMSHEKAQDMLTSVVENNSPSPMSEEDEKQIAPKNILQTSPTSIPSPSSTEAQMQPEIQHLDLAVPCQPLDTQGANGEGNQERSELAIPRSPLDQTEPSKKEGADSQKTSPTESSEETSAHGKLEIPSGIPRLTDLSKRRIGPSPAAILQRTQSQPGGTRREKGTGSLSPTHRKIDFPKRHESGISKADASVKHHEKRLSERFGLSVLKAGVNAQSMIPRSVAGRRKESKVSTLAKHFEQLSREFEQERLRDRNQRNAKADRSRVYPMRASKPIIEEYKNVHEAVAEREPSDEELPDSDPTKEDSGPNTIERMAQKTIDKTIGDGFHAADTAAESTAENTDVEDKPLAASQPESDGEYGAKSDEDRSATDESPSITDSQTLFTPSEASLDLKIDLPKHEKNSLIKMLTNFWAERSASGWQALEYPLNATDHIFADSDIIIREDEPSSLIAFALDSEDYKAKVRHINEKSANLEIRQGKPYVEDLFLTKEDQMRIERSLLQSTGTHLRYQFQEGSAKMICKIFYAEQFAAVRKKCGVDSRIVDSLSRCLKWDSKGGKTKSVFLKTLDDRLILKSLSQIEMQAFLRFAPAYFELMGEALFHELPSVIAKMLGFYQVVIRNPVTGVDFNWYLLVMENLFYDRAPDRIFDLKGSMRNRRIQSTGEQNEVLLDENMVEFIYETPLFAREHSKRLLGASVFNDTLFLSRQNVMDYSLMVAIDEVRKELVVGIIDCIRTYTWDKKLESWMKDRGKNRPTVTSPKEYKNRFREAMGRYILQAPTYVTSSLLAVIELTLLIAAGISFMCNTQTFERRGLIHGYNEKREKMWKCERLRFQMAPVDA